MMIWFSDSSGNSYSELPNEGISNFNESDEHLPIPPFLSSFSIAYINANKQELAKRNSSTRKNLTLRGSALSWSRVIYDFPTKQEERGEKEEHFQK